MSEWKLRRGDQEWTADSVATLRQWASSGSISATDYVFNPTLERWMFAREVPEVANELTSRAQAVTSSPHLRGFVVCQDCGYCGRPKPPSALMMLAVIAAFFMFIIPGLLLLILISSQSGRRCPACDGKRTVPAKSPEALRIIMERQIPLPSAPTPEQVADQKVRSNRIAAAVIFSLLGMIVIFTILVARMSNGPAVPAPVQTPTADAPYHYEAPPEATPVAAAEVVTETVDAAPLAAPEPIAAAPDSTRIVAIDREAKLFHERGCPSATGAMLRANAFYATSIAGASPAPDCHPSKGTDAPPLTH